MHYFARADGIDIRRAASMKRFAAGLSVRFRNLTIAMGRGGDGKSTGNALILAPIAPKRRTDSGSTVK